MKELIRTKNPFLTGWIAILAALHILVAEPYFQVQSGGVFEIDRKVIASGGQTTAGNGFEVLPTIVQPTAGQNTSGGSLHFSSGFWSSSLQPTAATVSISGRVRTSAHQAIGGVRVSITDMAGNTITTISSSFGYYSFQGLEAGRTYLLSVTATKFVFEDPVIIVNAAEDVSDLDFIALGQ
jgi:hypothetical protein